MRRRRPGRSRSTVALGLAGTVVTPGVVDERVIALLTETLAALDETDSATKRATDPSRTRAMTDLPAGTGGGRVARRSL